MPKLTHRFLESLKVMHAGTRLHDEGNLYGRVRAKVDGTVSVAFFYRYRHQGKLKDFSCGSWPNDSLAAIRSTRDAAKLKLAEGLEPGDEKKVRKIERQREIQKTLEEVARKQADALTVRDLFDVWLIDGVRRRDGNAELMRSFNADVLPAIGTRAIADLNEHDLRGVLRSIVARGANRSAVAMRNNLKQLFAWAGKRQPWRRLLADGDPMDLIDIEQIVDADYDINQLRDRVLSPAEIQELDTIFQCVRAEYEQSPNKRYGPQPIEQTTERAVWIMLSTMCRVGELSMARWENIDFEKAEWFVPKSDVKGRFGDLDVFLSAFALDQFRRLHELTGHTAWCFPSKLREGHIDTKSIGKQIGDRQVTFKRSRDGGPRSPMKHRPHDNLLVLAQGKSGAWTPHDLRRTGATMMQALGVSLDVIDRCQNHVLAGSKVRRHYMHHDYADEKRIAWSMLGERLTAILKQGDL